MVCRVGVENKAQNSEVTSPCAFQVSDSTSKKDIYHHMQHIDQDQVLWQSHEQQEIGILSTPKATHSSLMLRRWAAVIAITTINSTGG